MTDDDFRKFRHACVHQLMALNEDCAERFKINEWPRYDYDLDSATLKFSEDGVTKVITDVQHVGTTSHASKTWMWSWANSQMPAPSKGEMHVVREFGEREGIEQLSVGLIPDNPYLGWEQSAVTASLLKAKGAYRCPGLDGFLYFVYTDIRQANDADQQEARA